MSDATAKHVLTAKARDSLFNAIKKNAKFREALKKDWRGAIEKLGIKPNVLAGQVISQKELLPFKGQKAGWTIEIVISAKPGAAERIKTGFDKRLGFTPR